jgi:hypothetical protein
VETASKLAVYNPEEDVTSVAEELKKLAHVDLFAEMRNEDRFVGRPFYLDFDRLRLLSNDSWKHRVSGVPAGAFLLCVYDGGAAGARPPAYEAADGRRCRCGDG